MYKIGLTGGIGSGKSRVADLLEDWGAAIIDSDVIAHELTAPGGMAIEPIRQHFGPDVIAATGALDREAMRNLAFESPGARQQLESILHPMIKSVIRQRTQEAHGSYLVYVVPLLVESGQWHDRVHRICVVDCDKATQIQRVRARSGLTEDTIARIMSAQATREARLAVADDVIVNDANTSLEQLISRVRSLHEAWCRLAQQEVHPLR